MPPYDLVFTRSSIEAIFSHKRPRARFPHCTDSLPSKSRAPATRQLLLGVRGNLTLLMSFASLNSKNGGLRDVRSRWVVRIPEGGFHGQITVGFVVRWGQSIGGLTDKMNFRQMEKKLPNWKLMNGKSHLLYGDWHQKFSESAILMHLHTNLYQKYQSSWSASTSSIWDISLPPGLLPA